jgi:phosphinothricin acetyltransferase
VSTVAPTTIRAAVADDASRIAQIYSEGIADGEATFETAPRTAADVVPWLGRPREPVLVAERGGDVVGFARLTPYSPRACYAGVGDYAIYLAREARGRGIGRPLLQALVAAAQDDGYWKVIGRVFTTNVPSVALARACGFREVGVHLRHGRLDGVWKDVVVLERLLGDAAR